MFCVTWRVLLSRILLRDTPSLQLCLLGPRVPGDRPACSSHFSWLREGKPVNLDLAVPAQTSQVSWTLAECSFLQYQVWSKWNKAVWPLFLEPAGVAVGSWVPGPPVEWVTLLLRTPLPHRRGSRPTAEAGCWTSLLLGCCSSWFYCSCYPPHLADPSAAAVLSDLSLLDF